MRLIAAIDLEGVPIAFVAVNDTARPIFCTPAAYEKLTAQMLSSRCQACGVLARSYELDNGRCVANVGCAIDANAKCIRSDDPAAVQETLTIPHEIWHTFLDKMPRRGEYPPIVEGENAW